MADSTFAHAVTVGPEGFEYSKRCLNFFEREHGAAGYEELSVRVPGEAAFREEVAWHAIREAFGGRVVDQIALALRERFPAIEGAPPSRAPAPTPTVEPKAIAPAEARPRGLRDRAGDVWSALLYLGALALVLTASYRGGTFFLGAGYESLSLFWRARVTRAYAPTDAVVLESADRGVVESRLPRGQASRRRLAWARVRYEIAGRTHEPVVELEVPDIVAADRLMREQLDAFAPGRHLELLVDPKRPDAPVIEPAKLPGFVSLLIGVIGVLLGAVVGFFPWGVVILFVLERCAELLQEAWARVRRAPRGPS